MYLNGAHSTPKRKPASILSMKKNDSIEMSSKFDLFLAGQTQRMLTPSPCFADFSLPTPSNTTQQGASLPSSNRRRWAPTSTTKIKTADGSIIADIDQLVLPTNSNKPPLPPYSKSLFNDKQTQSITSKRAVKSAGTPSEALPKSAWNDHVIELHASQIGTMTSTNEIPLSQFKPTTIDQSWMPNWFNKTKSNDEIEEGSNLFFLK